MKKPARITLIALRVALGWVMFYAGITKVIDPQWSAAGYLENASTFPQLFEWLASPGILPVVNQLNQWGLTLIGVALIVGALVRWASIAGVLMMVLYWLPVLEFPYAGGHSFIIDDHIIYALALLMLAAANAGIYTGLDRLIQKRRS